MTNNNKHTIVNEIMQIRQLFLSVIEIVFVVFNGITFNISSFHSNTNLSIRLHFLRLQFL